MNERSADNPNMGTGASEKPRSFDLPAAPARRRQIKVILIICLIALLVTAALINLVFFGEPAPGKAGLLPAGVTIRLLNPHGSRDMVPIWAENRSSSAFVIWEPCRIERKETGTIVVGGTEVRVFSLPGTHSTKGVSVHPVRVELTGTNHGPWRLLMPVARYGLFARLEALLGKPAGTLVTKSHVLESLLRRSRMWVASDWFEEPSPFGFGPFPSRPASPGIGSLPLQHGGGPSDDSRTFFFILHHFGARYHRWPTNFAEVKSFAAAKENFQPEIPEYYRTPEYENAVFAIDAAGALTISHSSSSGHGTMSIKGPAPK